MIPQASHEQSPGLYLSAPISTYQPTPYLPNHAEGTTNAWVSSSNIELSGIFEPVTRSQTPSTHRSQLVDAPSFYEQAGDENSLDHLQFTPQYNQFGTDPAPLHQITPVGEHNPSSSLTPTTGNHAGYSATIDTSDLPTSVPIHQCKIKRNGAACDKVLKTRDGLRYVCP